ncbi:hypothetical protein TorRG33x02_177540, partial [Trema orientale]
LIYGVLTKQRLPRYSSKYITPLVSKLVFKMKERDSIEKEDDPVVDPNVTTSGAGKTSATTFDVLAPLDKMERALSTICMMMDIDVGDATSVPPSA